jgi:hypothetical protein
LRKVLSNISDKKHELATHKYEARKAEIEMEESDDDEPFDVSLYGRAPFNT